MVIPVRGSATYISTIGHIDGRIDLMVGNDGTPAIQLDAGNRSLMDLCMMASKLAYENAIVIKNVVNQHWKACFLFIFLIFPISFTPESKCLLDAKSLTIVSFITDALYRLLQLLEWYEITCIKRP